MRANGGTVIGNRAAQPSNNGIRIISGGGIVAQSARAEKVIPPCSVRKFNQSRSFDLSDFVCKILKIVADHPRSVIRIRPRTDFRDRHVPGFKSPFDRSSQDNVSIHSRSKAAMSYQRLESRIVNEVSFSVRLHDEIRSSIGLSENG